MDFEFKFNQVFVMI